MKLVADAKQFVRDAGRALESSTVRIAQQGAAEQQLLLASQIVGNCDMLIGVLRFLGETAPRHFGRFSESAIPRIDQIKRAAKTLRTNAFHGLFQVDEPDVVEGVPDDAQPAQPADPHADNQPAYPPPQAPHEFGREPTNPGVGNQT